MNHMYKDPTLFSKRVISELKERDIRPRWRGWFFLRAAVAWVLVGIAGVAAGVAMGTAIFLVADNDWGVAHYLGRSMFSYVLRSIPYVWIGVFALLVVFLFQNIRHTPRGYRYETSHLMVGSILGSVCIGFLLFIVGVNARVHTSLLTRLPLYSELVYEKHDIWKYPPGGLLSGIVQATTTDGFIVRDERNMQWRVLASSTLPYQDLFIIGKEVKIIGIEQAEGVFEARSVRP